MSYDNTIVNFAHEVVQQRKLQVDPYLIFSALDCPSEFTSDWCYHLEYFCKFVLENGEKEDVQTVIHLLCEGLNDELAVSAWTEIIGLNGLSNKSSDDDLTNQIVKFECLLILLPDYEVINKLITSLVPSACCLLDKIKIYMEKYN